MKNRLQFNRIPALFASGVTYLSGTTMGVSGREKATEALEAFVKRRDFIPLIGEPIVVRYIDDKGKKQAMLAIGKATGSTENDTRGIEYHIIDTAKLQEDIDLANENAAEALDLASAATKDNADYLVILKNMIMSGVGLSDGTYFDNNGRWDRDPSHVGLYVPIENANYIADATSFRDADDKLDKAIKGNTDNIEELSAATEDFSGATHTLINNILSGTGLNTLEPGEYPGHDTTMYIRDAESLDHADVLLDAAIAGTNAWFNGRCDDIQNQLNDEKGYRKALKIVKIDPEKFEELGIGDDVRDAYFLTHHKPNSTEPYEDPQEGDVIIKVYNETVTWDDLEDFSGITESYLKNIIEAEGLNADGTYDHERAHESINFKDAFDAFKADELLDQAIADLSANTIAADQVLDNKIDELSANTMAADEVLDNKIDELSANTMAADQALEDEIEALANRKVLGVSAITVNVLENGDSKVSLLINEEDDKVLTQNTLGLKANVSLVYSREDKKIYLKGKNDTTISSIDATDFIKDGMLSAASVFTATEADHQQYPELVVGKTYIKLLFNVDGEEPGRANPVFISAEDLVDIYTIAPESHTFMEINDYVIKLNVDVEDGLASYNYARNISAVTANIISATGLNMGEQGGYPGHDETHYIKNAGSLDQADVLLDEAIWGVNQGLAELSATTESFSSATHTVIENILAGTGLNTQEPGEYHGHDETHYIKSATSLDNADVLLDEALWAVSGMVAGFDERITEVEEDVEALSAVTKEFSATTHILIQELSARSVDLTEVYEYIDSADTAIKEHIDEVEEVVAGALNDLNERVSTIETHFNGEYIPLTGYEIASGLSEDELIVREEDTVNDAFGKIQKQILDNEEAVAAGLNDLNDRLDNVDDIIAHNTGITSLSAAVMSFSSITVNKFNNFESAVSIFESSVTEFEGEITEDVNNLSAFTRFLSAHTLGVLTVNLNGVEQGKYCPSASTTLNLEAIQEVTGADVLLTGYELATGTTEEELVVVATDTVNDAFGKVQKQIYDNETVIAGALNDLNGKMVELSGAVMHLEDVVSGGGASSHDVEILSGDVISLSAVVVSNQTKIQTLSGDVANCFDGAEYVSSAKTIIFKHGGVTKGSIDASDFIKDGMVSAVTISGTNLVITFNTDAGKEDIVIPLSNIFNPNNYYNKTEINALSGVVVNNVTNISNLSGAVVNNANNISNLSGVVANNVTKINNLSGSVVNNLNKINNLSGSVENLSGAVVNNRTDINSLSASLIDDELVIAAALNDLNRRVVAISGNSGSDSAKYYTTANTLTNLNFNEFLTIVKIDGNTTLSIASTGLPELPANGVAERHLIIENTGSTDAVVTITSDSRIKFTLNNQIAIDRSGGIGELNALITYDGSDYTIYVITT